MKGPRRVWYDITMALTFPTVLGTVIYSVLDTAFKELLVYIGFIDRTSLQLEQQDSTFFKAFGFSPACGLFVYLLLTTFIIVQYSCDYLYSKYFEKHYEFKHFICDGAISLLLAGTFISFSYGVKGDFESLRFSLKTLWFGLFGMFIIYALWVYFAYRKAAREGHKLSPFYRSMVIPFEIVSILGFAGLMFSANFITAGDTRLNISYLTVCLVVLAAFSVWFILKIKRLEELTR